MKRLTKMKALGWGFIAVWVLVPALVVWRTTRTVPPRPENNGWMVVQDVMQPVRDAAFDKAAGPYHLVIPDAVANQIEADFLPEDPPSPPGPPLPDGLKAPDSAQ